jgi:hypothetical protein
VNAPSLSLVPPSVTVAGFEIVCAITYSSSADRSSFGILAFTCLNLGIDCLGSIELGVLNC